MGLETASTALIVHVIRWYSFCKIHVQLRTTCTLHIVTASQCTLLALRKHDGQSSHKGDSPLLQVL